MATINFTKEQLSIAKYNDLVKFASVNNIKFLGLKKDELLEACYKIVTPTKQLPTSIKQLKDRGVSQFQVDTLIYNYHPKHYNKVCVDVMNLFSITNEDDLFDLCGHLYDVEGKNIYNLTKAESRGDLKIALLTESEIEILVDGNNPEQYDDVFDSVSERYHINEERLLRICDKIFKKEQIIKKKGDTKSVKAVELFLQGKRLCEIGRELNMHPSFVFTVISNHKKTL